MADQDNIENTSSLSATIANIKTQQAVQQKDDMTNESKTKKTDSALEEDILTQQKVADKLGLPFMRLQNFHLDPDALLLIPADFARDNDVIPLKRDGARLQVAMARPMDQNVFQNLGFISGLTIEQVVAPVNDIHAAIRRNYSVHDDEQALESIQEDENDREAAQELERLGSEKPIVKLVKNLIVDAIERQVSDVHIRPRVDSVELIYRIDGILVHMRFLSKSLLPGVVSRIKIIGGMDIAERRLPQDGRSCMKYNGQMVDMRFSVMPTVEGESVVIRLLNAKVGLKSVYELGFNDRDLGVFLNLIHKNNGILLVTGPTGSGKSTTLYAALAEVQKQNVNILTVEDPVEYHMDGVQQIQINHRIGYSFSRALRNILRHDPDVILVGEIRDQETANIAVESALTGHLILSTLHTNNASGAIFRLLEMGIEPYLLTGCLLGVLAQRLVKVNCPYCLEVEKVEPLVRNALGIKPDEKFFRSAGCEECDHSGVAGRLAVYELLLISDQIRKLIHEKVTDTDIQEVALKSGMVSLTKNALVRARAKQISLAEVYRVRLN